MSNVNSMLLNLIGKTTQFFRSQSELSVRKMSSKCKVAVLQLTATNNKEQNLNKINKLVKDAAEKQAKVIMVIFYFYLILEYF